MHAPVPIPRDLSAAAEPGDEWDDPVLPMAGPEPFILPPKREWVPADHPAARRRSTAEMGLQIGTKMRGGRRDTTPTATHATGPQTDVVKLECPPPDQPFQASQVIAAPSPSPGLAGMAGREKADSPAWGSKSRHVPRWLIAGAFGVTSVVAFALVAQERWLRVEPDDTPPEIELAEKEVPLPEIEGFETDGTSERESRELLEIYARADSAAQILPHVRNRSALESRITRDWQPWGAPVNWSGVWSATWEPGSEAGRSYGILTGHKPDFGSFRVYFVRENGAIKLDWEATEGQSEASFELLLRGSGTGGTVRAFVKPDAYYTPIFEESRFHCFKLVSPDRQQVVWAYTEQGGEADTRIMEFFRAGTFLDASQGELPMTLRLAPSPKGAQKNQWLLPEMLHNEWVSP